MAVAFISHPDCLLHGMGPLHPERAARLRAISDHLIASGLDALLRHYEAPLAGRAQLCRVHDADYVERIFSVAPREGGVFLDADTGMNPHSLNAALRAAGAGVLAVDLVIEGSAKAAFCSVRPPGHHAERDRAMGFCLFNNIAVAAVHALQDHGLERIAIVDFDVHHGNGTEHIFENDDRILLCSTFQHPFYPHSGAVSRNGRTINVPLSAGSDGAAFRDAVVARWLPALDVHRPQLILISAGFDAHVDDEIAGLAWVDDDYAWITRQIRGVADRHCGGRIVSMLEGGYELDSLSRCVETHIRALL